MRYCAQSLETQLTPNVSSTWLSGITKALISYFGYASTARYISHFAFGIDEWEDLIYNELANKRPVAYGGLAEVGGHGFVCDGYDVDDLFHFNWGWEGKDDGYFSLNVVNPYLDATTGFSRHTGFTYYQDAIIGIQPPSEETEQPLPLGSFELEDISQEKDYTIRFQFKYHGWEPYPPLTIDHALGTIEADGTLNPRFIGDPNDSIVYSNSNQMFVDIDPAAINPGESLVLYPMIKRRHQPDADWMMMDSKAYLVQAGRTEDGEFHMECVKPLEKYQELLIVDAQLNPESGRVGKTTNIILTIRNGGEEEFIDKLYLRTFYYGDIKAEDITDDTPYTYGEQIWAGALLRVGEDTDISFCFTPLKNGTVIFELHTVDVDSEKNGYMDECAMEINDPTGIASMSDVRSQMEDVWYDLQGRKLEGKPTQKGIYICNGAKFVAQ